MAYADPLDLELGEEVLVAEGALALRVGVGGWLARSFEHERRFRLSQTS
jgi:hypothetical protein